LKIKTNKVIFAVILLLILALYYFFDPGKNQFFIRCPFKAIFGYDCPGCGSQRALYSLLHLRLLEAFTFNPLFVIAIFILLILLILKSINPKKEIFPKDLFRNKFFILLLISIVLLFLFLRNTYFYEKLISRFKTQTTNEKKTMSSPDGQFLYCFFSKQSDSKTNS
jgi:magnesium-transporting ATPase (P-type)